MKKKVASVVGDKKRMLYFPTLEECRAAFSEIIDHKLDWNNNWIEDNVIYI